MFRPWEHDSSKATRSNETCNTQTNTGFLTRSKESCEMRSYEQGVDKHYFLESRVPPCMSSDGPIDYSLRANRDDFPHLTRPSSLPNTAIAFSYPRPVTGLHYPVPLKPALRPSEGLRLPFVTQKVNSVCVPNISPVSSNVISSTYSPGPSSQRSSPPLETLDESMDSDHNNSPAEVRGQPSKETASPRPKKRMREEDSPHTTKSKRRREENPRFIDYYKTMPLALPSHPGFFPFLPPAMPNMQWPVPHQVNDEDIRRACSKKVRPKNYACHFCEKCFSNSGQLKAHIRTHTGERPFACSFKGCPSKFTRNEELTRHRKIHTGEKHHVCVVCGKGFARKDHLNKHEKRHMPARPHWLVPDSVRPVSMVPSAYLHDPRTFGTPSSVLLYRY